MGVTKSQIRLLRPYLEGDEPSRINIDEDTSEETREWDLHCPLHEDVKRSASLNVDKGVWYCNVCGKGGTVLKLVQQRENWMPPPVNNDYAPSRNGRRQRPQRQLTRGLIEGWHEALLDDEPILEELVVERGITTDTLKRFLIGWSKDDRVYTIPIFNEDRSEILNVRYYNMHPRAGRRKIWQEQGYPAKLLYPLEILAANPDEIIVGEGEWDILLTIQNGYAAVTRTGAADVWLPSWGEQFEGKLVYVAHDRDDKGERADRKVAKMLSPHAREVRKIELPFPHKAKDGDDLTDFWKQYEPQDMARLLSSAKRYRSQTDRSEPRGDRVEEVTVLESFEATRVAKPMKLLVTIRGRNETSYVIPRKASLECDQSAGTICQVCPLFGKGEGVSELLPSDEAVLAVVGESKQDARKVLLAQAEVPTNCKRVTVDVTEHQPVEVLHARPPIDYNASRRDPGEQASVRITHVGEREFANSTVAFTGARLPHPRSHSSEFLAWDAERYETSIDKFELSDAAIARMTRFQTEHKPLHKLVNIARELSERVTHIYGRHEMHVLMELVFHSALQFKFAGELIQRGWLEALVTGDTRTGKSLAAERLVRHYGAGEIIGCESASFAGVIGGLQQTSNREWATTWGVVPLNDRRAVVLDEVNGLTTEEISQMSDVRSSGLAKITKIQQSVALARTRLLWLGNPRDSYMGRFTYGVDAIKPLIGNNEDIARFDLAMTVADGEVPIQEVNRMSEPGSARYTSEVCHTMLMWVWTRATDQVVWTPGTEQAVIDAAFEVGSKYVPVPPLVQAANIRVKLARLSVAIAARLFSTDESWENIIVKPEHVAAAAAFLNHLYAMPGFGYYERSRQRIADTGLARKNREKVRAYLKTRPNLASFLLRHGSFKRQDLDEVLNVQREEANAIINTLYECRMISKETGFVIVEPTLHELLREVA